LFGFGGWRSGTSSGAAPPLRFACIIWPVYLTVLRSRYECPAAVLVVAPDKAVARWASKPIDLGNGGCVVPVVIGRGTMPRITDVKAARESPALAMLCAIMYGNDRDSVEIVPASHEAASAVPRSGDSSGGRRVCVSAQGPWCTHSPDRNENLPRPRSARAAPPLPPPRFIHAGGGEGRGGPQGRGEVKSSLRAVCFRAATQPVLMVSPLHGAAP
jgi:hypothetical protein